jgi:hypothetical protein
MSPPCRYTDPVQALLRIESRTLGRPARSLLCVQTDLSWLWMAGQYYNGVWCNDVALVSTVMSNRVPDNATNFLIR